MLTAKGLRDVLEGLEDDAPVVVALVGAEDGQRLLDAAMAHQEDDGIDIKVPMPLKAVAAYEADDGKVLIFAVSQGD